MLTFHSWEYPSRGLSARSLKALVQRRAIPGAGKKLFPKPAFVTSGRFVAMNNASAGRKSLSPSPIMEIEAHFGSKHERIPYVPSSERRYPAPLFV